jgi:ferredoxin
MREEIAKHAAGLLQSGEIDGFLALADQGEGKVAPYLFSDPAELASLSLGDLDQPAQARYPLVKIAARLLEARPSLKLGVLVRGCDERALLRLTRDDRVHPLAGRRLVPVGLACPGELARDHACAQPWPEALVAGEKAAPAAPAAESDEDLLAELAEWLPTLDRCLKCHGCRDVCPVCSCYECTLETEAHVPQRELPASHSFLLTRAMHMVDRCVYCGLCEEACPAGIPLKGLYRLAAKLAGREGMLPQAPQPGDEPAAQEA